MADGNTLTVLVDRHEVKMRLTEIDAPEKNRPFGNRSKQSLAAPVMDRGPRLFNRSNKKAPSSE